MDYEAIDAINFSSLKSIAKSPAHFVADKNAPRKDTTDTQVGRALHAALLEPDVFAAEYACPPEVNRRTNKGKEEWAEFARLYPNQSEMNQEKFEVVLSMRDAVLKNPVALEILSGEGQNELTLQWEDFSTGEACKGRIDRVTDFLGQPCIVDVKTTKGDASPQSFGREIARYRYHVQAAWYQWGASENGYDSSAYHFLVIEKSLPYACRVMTLDALSLEAGYRRQREWLDTYHECKETGAWPGYSQEPVPVSLPKWESDE